MYEVYCDGQLMYNTTIDDKTCILHDAKLDLELNKAGSFTFTIYPSHGRYDLIYPLKSMFTVYQDGYLMFRGRVLNTTKGFHNEKQVLCEGELAFLCDSVQRPYDFSTNKTQTTVSQLFAFFINNHNAQVVDESKRFKVGKVSVSNETIRCLNENYSVTWDAINDNLIDAFGGYLWVRHESDGNYIDYISDFDTLSNQPVKFGKNLLSIKKEDKGEDIATALIPIGAKDVDIKKVNNGVDYIHNAEAVKEYGWIFKTETWSDIEEPADLYLKAQKRLKELSEPLSSIEVSAADLSSIEDFNAFRLGTYVTADSSPHGLDANFIVKKLQITLAKPSANKLTLDGTFESFTQITNTKKLKNEVLKKTTAIEGSEAAILKQLANIDAKLNYNLSVDSNGVVQEVAGASNKVIKFESNVLSINSDKFKLSPDGSVEARDITLKNESGYYSVTIGNGVISVVSPSEMSGEGLKVDVLLMEFTAMSIKYGLYAVGTLDEDLNWVFSHLTVTEITN